MTYHNLTQNTEGRLVYFRSTDVENKHYHRLLWSVPDEWLYLLSQGEKITLIDKSSNNTGKIERIFVPVLIDVLRYFLLNLLPKNKNLTYHFCCACQAIREDAMLKKKFTFWRGKIKKIDIAAKTIKIEKEVKL